MYAFCTQVVPVRVKRYSAPESSADRSSCLPLIPLEPPFSSCAPTASVLPSPLSVSRDPNQSSLFGCEDLMNACCVQVPLLRTKTYTAPVELSNLRSLSHPGGLMPGV